MVRRALAGVLAAVRGPSTWTAADAPLTLQQRLHALVDEHVADSDKGRRTALRHHIARRLLDDPVVYLDTLAPEARIYFINQRGAMAARLGEAAGLRAEQRAEGLALVDESGVLTDVAMPSEGTDAHVTLLAAEFLARREQQQRLSAHALPAARVQDVADYLRAARERFGNRDWRKSAREPGPKASLQRSRSSAWKSCSWSSEATCLFTPGRRLHGLQSVRPNSEPPKTAAPQGLDRHERPLDQARSAARTTSAADTDAPALATIAAWARGTFSLRQ